MKMHDLIPTNGRKSFYGKAQVVVEDNGDETLFSFYNNCYLAKKLSPSLHF